MTYFHVMFLAFSCIGDVDISMVGVHKRPIPESARQAAAVIGLCKPRLGSEMFTRIEDAEKRIKELGPSSVSRLEWCNNLRCFERSIRWESVLKTGG